MRFIFRLIGFIWRTIWRLVGLAVFLLICALVFIFATQGQASSRLLDNTVTGIQQILSQESGSLSFQEGLNTAKSLMTDQINQGSTSRWPTNAATVYIETQNTTLRQAYETAIANWNATGAFTFTLVDDASQANIIATEVNDAATSAAGEAVSSTNTVTNYLTSVTVKLNTHYLLNDVYGYDMDRIVHTAEHDLGHAIGLDHKDGETSVMESAGSYHGIQQTDIDAVNQLYTS